MIAKVIATLSNPVTAVVAGLTTLSLGVLGATKGIERLGTAVVEGYRGLEKYNGSIAVMFAQLDRQQVILGARYAAATGGSANFAGKGLMGLREQLAPLQQTFGTFKNLATGGLIRVAEGILRVVNVVLWPLKKIAEGLEWIVGGGGEAQKAPIADLFGILGMGQLASQQRKPHNRRPGKVD